MPNAKRPLSDIPQEAESPPRKLASPAYQARAAAKRGKLSRASGHSLALETVKARRSDQKIAEEESRLLWDSSHDIGTSNEALEACNRLDNDGCDEQIVCYGMVCE